VLIIYITIVEHGQQADEVIVGEFVDFGYYLLTKIEKQLWVRWMSLSHTLQHLQIIVQLVIFQL
jgi:hypothetical protein